MRAAEGLPDSNEMMTETHDEYFSASHKPMHRHSDAASARQLRTPRVELSARQVPNRHQASEQASCLLDPSARAATAVHGSRSLKQKTARTPFQKSSKGPARLVLVDGVVQTFGMNKSGIERQVPSTLLSAPANVHIDPSPRFRKTFTRKLATPVNVGVNPEYVKRNIYEGQVDGMPQSDPTKGTYNYPMNKMEETGLSWSSVTMPRFQHLHDESQDALQQPAPPVPASPRNHRTSTTPAFVPTPPTREKGSPTAKHGTTRGSPPRDHRDVTPRTGLSKYLQSGADVWAPGLTNQAIPAAQQAVNQQTANGVLIDGILKTLHGDGPSTMLSAPPTVHVEGSPRANMVDNFSEQFEQGTAAMNQPSERPSMGHHAKPCHLSNRPGQSRKMEDFKNFRQAGSSRPSLGSRTVAWYGGAMNKGSLPVFPASADSCNFGGNREGGAEKGAWKESLSFVGYPGYTGTSGATRRPAHGSHCNNGTTSGGYWQTAVHGKGDNLSNPGVDAPITGVRRLLASPLATSNRQKNHSRPQTVRHIYGSEAKRKAMAEAWQSEYQQEIGVL